MRAVLLLALLIAGCAPTPKSDVSSGTIALQPCREPGIADELRCGTFQVAEDPADPGGRIIDLKIVVVPATDRAKPDPLFFLAGGPGQGATETIGMVLGFLADTRDDRDLVFVDIRGTGGSNKLSCDPPDVDLAARLEFQSEPDVLQECLASYDADTRHYNTPQFVADLDAVRGALGYTTINLYGGSYGTRLGLAYIAAHGDRVRSAVLDGLAPYAMKLFVPFGVDGKVTLDRLFADCAADSACGEAFPDLEPRFWTWLNGLETGEPTRMTLRDPRTGGRAIDVPLERASIASAIRGLLYSTEYAALLPQAMEAAIAGDPQSLVGQALILGEGASGAMAGGLLLSTVCAEDLPRITPEDRGKLAWEPFMGTSMIDMMGEACAVWPTGEVPESLFEPVKSDVPVLLLSGAEDPVTPERWATETAKTLTNVTSVTVPATAHIAARGGCADQLIADFYNAPDGELDTVRDCLSDVKRPLFFLSTMGPKP